MKLHHLFQLLCMSIAALAAGASDSGSFLADKPRMAHWTFDSPTNCTFPDESGNGCHATAKAVSPGIATVPGVFKNAVEFSGSHLLQCSNKPAFGPLSRLSFSAWVQPASFQQYNEIFRKEDGDRRVLFSFQEHGHILSLGLNINGYVECDAPIDPSRLLDGFWHHAAATFDGSTMRVYLDGKEIGRLERPGRIASGGPGKACIGSLNGTECFQGLMDELEIYEDDLTAGEIERLHRNGMTVLERAMAPIVTSANLMYPTGYTFTRTLSILRTNLLNHVPDKRLCNMLAQKLSRNFPGECTQFRQWSGMEPSRYMIETNRASLQNAADRLLALLIEYKPLTESQWKKQTAEAMLHWNDVAGLEQRFATLRKQTPPPRSDAEWMEWMMEAGRRITWRPQEHEAVAPYITPHTPETRNFSEAEERERVRKDWLFQAGGKITTNLLSQEIKWTQELLARTGLPAIEERNKLNQLQSRINTPGTDIVAIYYAIREIKRGIMFRNPAIDFERIVFIDMPFPAGSEWNHETRHRLGYMAQPGARLMVREGLQYGGNLRQLMPQAPLHGSFWRPDVSFDGKRILFCYKPHNEKTFHLYETMADGTGLRQITDGIFDDLDPVYLPDGHILFSTTRGHTYVRCMPPTSAFSLARCNSDGTSIYLISANNEPDYLPSLLNDGRVIYTRWEYTDKPLWRAQKLWTIHPDGTQVQMYWGNQSVWPDVTKDVREIPGSHRVMFTGCGHHAWFDGCVGIIDPSSGFNFPNGLTKVTADLAWPECGNGPVDVAESPRYHSSGAFTAYYSPYPLGERDFLVSARRNGKFALYLMDTDGNRELIHEGTHHIFHAMPLKARSTPAMITDRVAWPSSEDRSSPKDGIIFSDNVYQGAPGVLNGRARYLRVFSIDHKTYTYWYKRPYISTGPVVSGVQSEGVKRILGTVPIEADGSVAFHAPSGLPLHFQLLDENQKALHTMRSFANVMPGEYRGCLGCHESHSRSPAGPKRSLALNKPPRTITPPPWSDTTVSFARYVRPVLDQYCGSCHEGNGEGQKTLDLSFRPGFLGFDETYWHLIGRPSWGTSYKKPDKAIPGFGIADMIMVEAFDTVDPTGYRTPPPMQQLSYKSRLIEKASSGKHHSVTVDPANLLRLIHWVDAMCPYLGDEEVRQEPDPVFQGVDWLAIKPRIASAPRIIRPGPVN